MIRYYQCAAVRAVLEAVAGGRRAGLLVLPTGTGKTLVALTAARLINLPTLFLVHRDELVRQTVAAAGEHWPLARVGVVKAEQNEWTRRDLVVASVQSFNAARLADMNRDAFGLLVTDEAHHALADTYLRAAQHFHTLFHLGVTATPDRLDGRGLADVFGHEPLYTLGIRAAIKQGYLVPLVQYAVETQVCLDGVARVGRDFNRTQLAGAVNTPERNRVVVEAYLSRAAGRRMIAFAVDVQHAFDLALAFEECGIRAAAVHGGTPSEERRDVLARFAGGRLRVLVNCSILLEGFDDPDIEGVIMARPTDSYALYAQAIGRALRLPRHNRRKINALVLDVTDNCRRHKLKTAFDLLGSTSTRNDAAGADVLALAEADETAEEARQEELRLRVASRPVSWRLESVCPWPELPTLDGYTPSAPWHGEPATDEQTKYLRRLGLEVRRGLTRGEASWLIDRGRTLDAGFPAPASPKMQFFLRLHGEWEDGMTKREAGRRIGRIKKQQKVEG